MKITLRQLFLLLTVLAVSLAVLGRPLGILLVATYAQLPSATTLAETKYFLKPFADFFWLLRLEWLLPAKPAEDVMQSGGLGELCLIFGFIASVAAHWAAAVTIYWLLVDCIPRWWQELGIKKDRT